MSKRVQGAKNGNHWTTQVSSYQRVKMPTRQRSFSFFLRAGCMEQFVTTATTVCHWTLQTETEQVVQLSLTNPRVALHHD